MNKLDNIKPSELKQAITTRYKRPDLVYKHIKRNLSNLLDCNYVEWSVQGNTLYIYVLTITAIYKKEVLDLLVLINIDF